MPPATMDAFRDHGKVAATPEQDVDEAQAVLTRRRRSALDLDGVTAQLVERRRPPVRRCRRQAAGAVASKRARPRRGDRRQRSCPTALDTGRGGDAAVAPGGWSAGCGRATRRSGPAATRRSGSAGWTSCERQRRYRGRCKPCQDVKRGRLQRRRAARHGRLQPGAGGDRPRSSARQPGSPKLQVLDSTDPEQIARSKPRSIRRTRCSSSPPSRAPRWSRTCCRPISSPLQKRVGKAGRPGTSSPSPIPARGWRRPRKQAFARSSRRSGDRRPLFGAVQVRHGAGRGDRDRRQGGSRPPSR